MDAGLRQALWISGRVQRPGPLMAREIERLPRGGVSEPLDVEPNWGPLSGTRPRNGSRVLNATSTAPCFPGPPFAHRAAHLDQLGR